jgi:hypothetical protein
MEGLDLRLGNAAFPPTLRCTAVFQAALPFIAESVRDVQPARQHLVPRAQALSALAVSRERAFAFRDAEVPGVGSQTAVGRPPVTPHAVLDAERRYSSPKARCDPCEMSTGWRYRGDGASFLRSATLLTKAL